MFLQGAKKDQPWGTEQEELVRKEGPLSQGLLGTPNPFP